jgi:hypothetical protein
LKSSFEFSDNLIVKNLSDRCVDLRRRGEEVRDKREEEED